MREMGVAARQAARELARAGTDVKDRALRAMAAEIRRHATGLLEANRADVDQARKEGRDGAFIDRLEGSFTNVVGLPMAETLELLALEGIVLPWEAP